MCNVYVAVRLIQLHPEFITDIFILSCPWQVITFASANRHASASACFGLNATALLPHCANTSARRLTAPALTNIGEPALILIISSFTQKQYNTDDTFCKVTVLVFGDVMSRDNVKIIDFWSQERI